MDKLLGRVEKELENIADKGLSSSNLDTTFKLIDIYKDIKEADYYDNQVGGSYGAQRRDSRGRYMGDRDAWKNEKWDSDRKYEYENLGPMKRYFDRLEDDMDTYNMNRGRYRKGDSSTRIEDGIDMVMDAIHKMVECLYDYAETAQEKEIVRKHIDKMKSL